MNISLDELVKAVVQGRIKPGEAVEQVRDVNNPKKLACKEENEFLGDVYSRNFQWNDFYVENHTINGNRVIFGMMYCSLVVEAIRKKYGLKTFSLRDVTFHTPVVVSEGKSVEISVDIQVIKSEIIFSCGASLEGGSSHKIIADGRLSLIAEPDLQSEPSIQEAVRTPKGSCDDPYATMAASGIEHSEQLKALAGWSRSKDVLEFELETSLEASFEDEAFYLSPTLLNAVYLASSVFGVILPNNPVVPLSIRCLSVFKELKNACRGKAELVASTSEFFIVNVWLYDGEGLPILMLEGLTGKLIHNAERLLGDKARESSTVTIDSKGDAKGSKRDRLSVIQSEGGGMHERIKAYLINVVKNELGRSNLELDDSKSFMEVGLSSSHLLKIVKTIEKDLSVELYPTIFFEYQTLSAVTEYFLNSFSDKFEKTLYKPESVQASVSSENHNIDYKSNDTGVTAGVPVSKTPSPQRLVDERAIAIIGMSGRFPGANTLDEFWQRIVSSDDLISEIPESRWSVDGWFDPSGVKPGKSYCKWGSFIDSVDKFDAELFKISPREAAAMDPQLRLLLMVLYETVEDAGYGKSIWGSNTGMYVGACFREYWDEMLRSHLEVEPYDLTGNASCFLSNRPSYYFDLRGPSVSVDNACSSSLVALHMACKALLNGECDKALVAGVNLLLSPLHYLHFSSIEALSKTGRCHTFDASADGYVPGEAVAAVMLKPLAKAIAEGDNIHAVIKGSAINHAGRSNSPTAPSIGQQRELLLKAWDDAGIDPGTLGYIEAHGTGTKLGDPIEIRAIKNALSAYPPAESKCAIGSAKAHIGHTEGAAGISGVIKTVLSIKNQTIPAMPGFNELNPFIDFKDTPLFINKMAMDWERTGTVPLRAGVSSFGLGGAYAHVVLEEYSSGGQENFAINRTDDLARIIPLSAQTEEQLREYCARLGSYLQSVSTSATDFSTLTLDNIAYTLQTGRHELECRVAFKAISKQQLCDDLLAFAEGRNSIQYFASQIESEKDWQIKEWLSGGSVDWDTLGPSHGVRRISLPTYPFILRRYWTDKRSAERLPKHTLNKNLAETVLAPSPLVSMLGTSGDEVQCSASFKYDDIFSSHHIINGNRIIPGVVHLEIAYEAGSLASNHKVTGVDDFYWLRPMSVGLRGTDATIAIRKSTDSLSSFSIKEGETILSSGRMRWAIQDSTPPPLDLLSIQERCPTDYPVAGIYTTVEQLGLELGGFYKTLVTLRGNENEAIGEIVLSDDQRSLGNFVLPPSIMDCINHCARGIVTDDTNKLGLAVPYYLEKLDIFAPISSRCFVHVRRTDLPESNRCFDYTVTDENGNILVVIKGFMYRDYKDVETSDGETLARKSAVKEGPSSADVLAPVMAELTSILSSVLDIPRERIRQDRNLAEYGADSVAIAEFTRAVNDRLSLSLTPARFFEHNTLAGFGEYIQINHPLVRERFSSPTTLVVKKEPVVSEIFGVDPSDSASVESDIAVVGMSGIFPQSENLQDFWKNLVKGKDLITEIPPERFSCDEYYGDPYAGNFSVSKWGGFLNDIDCFDAKLFGISAKEAELMDPQQRLFLQTTWAALEHSGYAPRTLAGKNVGVFVGVVNNEYYELLNKYEVDIEAHTATGMARSILPNRISYLLDFHGPSEIVDTACSSSLVAVHKAVQALRDNECELAIAGGVNIILTPNLYISFSKAGMLSPDGKCKTFDKDANGYVRGEGVGAVVLKSLQRAIEDGDSIYGVIRGTGINHGGRVNSLTTPNPIAQAKLISHVYKKAGVDPKTISYIEAHGTGTPLGDPVEINALRKVFEGSDMEGLDTICGVGSVKSNIGHLESAAGIAGLIKVLLSINEGIIPPSINFNELNPYIELDASLRIVDRPVTWKRPHTGNFPAFPRRAGVSSFGFGGVNAHVLLEEYPELPRKNALKAGPKVIVLSARTVQARSRYVKNLAAHIERDHLRKTDRADSKEDAFSDMAFTLQVGRDEMEYRVAFVASSFGELKDQLEWFTEHEVASTERGIYAGNTKSEMESGFLDEPDKYTTHELARYWTEGMRIVWHKLPGTNHGRRVALPTYPFDKTKFWIPGKQYGLDTNREKNLVRNRRPAEKISHPLFDAASS